MGSIQTKQSLPNQQNFDLLDYGYCTVWKRKYDQLELMQEYPVQIQTAERLQAFQYIWPLRTKSQFFVNVYYFSHQKNSNFCGQLAKGSIFTQRIPYRLSQFSNLPFQQTISILNRALQVYGILYDQLGLFLVRSTMIGFTEDFQIKFWFHTDFSEPQPENVNCDSIQQMIHSIISSIQSIGQHYYYSSNKFTQFINQPQNKMMMNSFEKVLKVLNQYSAKMKLTNLEYFEKIKYCKKQPQGWQKFKEKTTYPVLILQKSQKKNTNSNAIQLKKYINGMTMTQKSEKKSIYQNLGQTTMRTSRALNNQNETNYRGFVKQFNLKDKLSPDFRKIQQFQFSKPDVNLRFWKSIQKNINITPSKSLSQNIFSSNFNEPTVKTQSQKKLENEYFKQPFNVTHFKKINEQKRSEVSTTTQNLQKSSRSSISLIQDLEFKQHKNTAKRVLNFKKH